MDIKYGLFSCDSHAQLDRDAWTKRMSNAQWGDRIPQVVEVNGNGHVTDHWMIQMSVHYEIEIPANADIAHSAQGG